MRSFKDTSGAHWEVAIDVPVARVIRSRTEIDVHSMFSQETLTMLAGNTLVLTDLLWAVVERQAEKRGVSELEFFQRLDSEIIETATDLLFDAVVDYLPEKKRKQAARLLAALRAAGKEAIQLASKQLDKSLKKMETTLASTNGSTSLPESSAPASSKGGRSGRSKSRRKPNSKRT